ncbi:uncharacterized protein CDV56_104042 [Aspergillus thermomutatus]|uniref:Uncharacterized protein n=1 Tax=Aspergillus thermomutatus TaxID=41047 RepID=A0A397G900_ASPTH|nr:uncharacterized protein CDV56_104042 [Aspergillus thermomutatus]RHZ46499.1 hypothetical protein CDV56_104042 [Aspergillus thermomutatus]
MASSTPAAQRPVSSNKDDNNGPVGDLYSKIITGGFGLWVSAVVVLGLSAGIISKSPPSPLRPRPLTIWRRSITKPVSCTNARPREMFIVILAFTTLMWGAAFPLMFVMRSNHGTYEIINPDKRVVLSIGTGIVSALQNITIACACLGVSAL